jgi:5-methyltetrahydrofolate--homocysteine methyltransferase
VEAKVVLGTVRGDIHDMGKSIVRITLEYGGYEVIDLGSDVPTNEFIKAAREEKADVVALSTLMTPTLRSMAKVVSELKQQKIDVRTIIGGWATSPEFAQEIGADAWGKDALEGLSKLDSLIIKNE